MSSALLETQLLIKPGFTPMERILLTANGNVQRILSSYYNEKVSVRVLFNQEKRDSQHEFERRVEIICNGRVHSR
jgi:hypothetical protein